MNSSPCIGKLKMHTNSSEVVGPSDAKSKVLRFCKEQQCPQDIQDVLAPTDLAVGSVDYGAPGRESRA